MSREAERTDYWRGRAKAEGVALTDLEVAANGRFGLLMLINDRKQAAKGK